MKEAANIPVVRIEAKDPQTLISLKLRYNALADRINQIEKTDRELDELLTKVKQLNTQIISYY